MPSACIIQNFTIPLQQQTKKNKTTMANYSLDPNRPRLCMVFDYFYQCGGVGMPSGSLEDCEASLAEQSVQGMGEMLVQNFKGKKLSENLHN
jgi:hypothetical protein